jgi:hypothetical protein
MKTKLRLILVLGMLSLVGATLFLANRSLAASAEGHLEAANQGLTKIFQPIVIKSGSQPQPGPTPRATPHPGTGENWLENGTFTGPGGEASFDGWSDDNGYWSAYLHDPLPCSPSDTWYLQMDSDEANNQWPGPGSQDWAWQDITPPGDHSILQLHWEEAHHLYSGIIQLTIYGRNNGGPWEIVYRQTGVQSPPGTGKCDEGGPPAVYDVTIPVGQGYDEYRLEVYGKMIDPQDAAMWGDFRLSGDTN